MPTILVTGASSGIGAALARCYAREGATLLLWGRNSGRLDEIASQCRAGGATVETVVQDLREISASMARLRELDRARPIDLAIFNAGVGGADPADPSTEPAERALEIATVNFSATAALATVMAEMMTPRRAGQIAIIGSAAQFFPLPMAPAYAGSKAGIALFAEALGLRLEPFGISVSVIAPGFIDTPMSRQLTAPRPFLIDADQAAAAINRLIAKKRRRAVIPPAMAVLSTFASRMPRSLVRRILKRF